MRGSVAICARDSTWNTPIVSASCSIAVDLRVVRRQVGEIEDIVSLRPAAFSLQERWRLESPPGVPLAAERLEA